MLSLQPPRHIPTLPEATAPLDPTVPIPCDVSHMLAAGLMIKQIDDECPHDRTPLLDQCFRYQDHVSGSLRMIRETVSSAEKTVSMEAGWVAVEPGSRRPAVRYG